MFIAVESGDFVNSTKMSEQTYSQAISCLESELKYHCELYQTEFEIFRGDAYQVLYPRPEYAFKAALLTKLKLLHAIDDTPVKVSQALFFGEQSISASSISQNMGEVSIQSGRLLDRTKKGAFNILVQSNLTWKRLELLDTNPAITLIQGLLNHHLAGMTQKQAEVVYYYISQNFSDQQTIADLLGMSRQNVAAHLKRGGANLFKQAIEFYQSFSTVIETKQL